MARSSQRGVTSRSTRSTPGSASRRGRGGTGGGRRGTRSARPGAALLSPDQRRELTGVLLLGLGLVVAAVLALPGGGSIAAPVHDALGSALGNGAWMLTATFFVAGGRLLGRRGWTGGLLGAAGSAAAAVAALAALGLASADRAGSAGRWLGGGLSDRLGGAAAAATVLVLACLGVVLALELRVRHLLETGWARLQAYRAARARTAAEESRRLAETGAALDPWPPHRPWAPDGTVPVAAAPERPSARRRAAAVTLPPGDGAGVDAVAELVPVAGLGLGAAEPPPMPTRLAARPASSAVAGSPTEVLDPVQGTIGPFRREFEGLPLDPLSGEAATGAAATASALAAPPIPAPSLGGPAPAAVDEPERSWTVPRAEEVLDVVRGKRERLEQEIRATIETIQSTLAAFGVEATVRGVNSGPTVTQYELQPARGVPVRRITGYQTDLSLALAAPIRVQAPIPGKAAIGVEVPNKAAQLVTLRDIVLSDAFTGAQGPLAVALGADVSGHPVVGELTRMPHLLVAGATGSGKSVCINAILGGLLLQATPAELKLILIDPKRVELSGFADIPHLLVPVVVEPDAAVASLRWAVKEMEERYKLFASHGARNIAAFNGRAAETGLDPLPYIVVVIDELADLMMVAAGEIEDLICRIAQLARAVGIHLIVATQRPSADIITGLIKANIPSRVAFAVSSGVDSRVILDEMGAEKLLGRGDMLYLPIEEGKPRRLQGAFVSDRELERLIDRWKAQGMPTYQEEIFQVEATATWAREAGKRDPLFAKAAHTVAAEGRAAASLLQRKLNVGYTRAARLVDQLAEHRVVGPYEGSKSREVLMDVIQVDEFLAELDDP